MTAIDRIGSKAASRLRALGIGTSGGLAAAPSQWLAEHFGANHGRWTNDAGHGRDARPLVTSSEPQPQPRSRETIFERDLHLERDWHEIADDSTTAPQGRALPLFGLEP